MYLQINENFRALKLREESQRGRIYDLDIR